VLLCAVVALALAGCGDDSGDGGASSGGASTGGGSSGGSDCSGAARTAPQITGDLEAGWRSREAPEETLDQFRELLSGADEDQGKVEKITGRAVTKGVEAGVVIVLDESDKPVDLDEMMEGAEEGSGKKPTTERLGDDPEGGRMISTDDGGASLFGTTDECSAVIVLGTSPVVAKRVATMLSL
jgi:hypothetical protein